MTIYRGPGGGGNADSDAEITELTALTTQALAYSEAAGLEADAAALSAAAASTSAANAAASEAGVAANAFSASTSASNASTSATNAATSASSASTSASAASTSATNAASSASAASTSATNAAASETNADASEASALTYSTAAAGSAVTASTQASNAATSASAAAGSATTASTQASNAATSASGAASSATNASNSASAASTSAANALASETAAATSAASIDPSTFVKNNAVGAISVSSSSTALRITQLGTGNALLVEDTTNPDVSPFVIDNGGNILQGTTTLLFDGVASISRLQSLSAGANNSRVRSIQHYGSSLGPILSFANSASATIGNFTTAVSINNTLGSTLFFGSDGTTLIQGASIAAQVDGTPGTNDMPGRLVFSTTADGASAPTERVRIDSAGNVGIGTNSPNASAILDAQSTTKGVRMPNMTTTQKNAIASPAAGLMVFDTTLAKLCVYTGAAWQTITST